MNSAPVTAARQSGGQPRKPSIFNDQRFMAMLLLGIASGLPFAVICGTLNAWFAAEKVSVSTIGVLSWSALAYSFKFLWSPAMHRATIPAFRRFGMRRSWFIPLQSLIAACLFGFSFLDPLTGIAAIAALAVLGAFLSATFDIVVDTWRIETASSPEELDSLTMQYQFGYRLASFVGGAGALILSDILHSWNVTLGILGGLMALTLVGALLAPEPEPPEAVPPRGGELVASPTDGFSNGSRNLVIAIVLLGWGWAFWVLGSFMIDALGNPEAAKPGPFTLTVGPFIVIATVLTPALGAVWLMHGRDQGNRLRLPQLPPRLQKTSDIMFGAIVAPMIELIGRMRWAAVLALFLILTYRLTDALWGSFAYPFYMGTEGGALGHTAIDVALASKIIGVIAIMAGVAVGGVLVKWFGRMPSLVAAAVLAAATNLLFADLARGSPGIDRFLATFQIGDLFNALGLNIRMARLTTAIMAENLAVGFASVVYVAYLSSIVNPKYAAVQYALLSSLTMLIGQLGRPAIGAMIESDGFASVFILTALVGVVPVLLSLAEWFRQSRLPKEGTTDLAQSGQPK
jgi:PAT family beta-lactamase induction signal transducer AmpG